MTICAYCDADTGLFDFSRDCCLTRFVVSAPTKERRIAHLAYIERQVGEERTAMVKLAVEEAWKVKRDKVFEFGRKHVND
jgi:hypothetical protein